jgi:hypothetical protein
MTRSMWIWDDLPYPVDGMDVTHRLSPINVRLRREYLVAAEADCRERRGRPLTNDKLARVLARYPGAVGSAGRPLRP